MVTSNNGRLLYSFLFFPFLIFDVGINSIHEMKKDFRTKVVKDARLHFKKYMLWITLPVEVLVLWGRLKGP